MSRCLSENEYNFRKSEVESESEGKLAKQFDVSQIRGGAKAWRSRSRLKCKKVGNNIPLDQSSILSSNACWPL